MLNADPYDLDLVADLAIEIIAEAEEAAAPWESRPGCCVDCDEELAARATVGGAR